MSQLQHGGLTHRGYSFLLDKLETYSYEFKDCEIDSMISTLEKEKERRRVEKERRQKNRKEDGV